MTHRSPGNAIHSLHGSRAAHHPAIPRPIPATAWKAPKSMGFGRPAMNSAGQP